MVSCVDVREGAPLWFSSFNTLKHGGGGVCLWRAGVLTCALEVVPVQPSKAANPSRLLGGFRSSSRCCRCLRPSRLRRIEASAGIQVLTVTDGTMRTSCFFSAHCVFVSSVSCWWNSSQIKKGKNVLLFYHIGGLFTSSTPYISASFLKRGPQSLR